MQPDYLEKLKGFVEETLESSVPKTHPNNEEDSEREYSEEAEEISGSEYYEESDEESEEEYYEESDEESEEEYYEESDEAAEEEYYEEADEESEDALDEDEIMLLTTDYTELVSNDPIEELVYLFDNYFKIRDLDIEQPDAKEYKKYAEAVIRAIVLEYDIPTHDLVYLFKFVLTLESYYDKHSNDVIFKEIDHETGLKTLKLRIDEYLGEYPNLFNEFEVYAELLNIDKSLTKTHTYKSVLVGLYETLIANPSVDTLDVMLDMYEAKANDADKYLEKMPLPAQTAEEMVAVMNILFNRKKSGSSIRKKIQEAKQIAASRFADDPTIASMIAEQNAKEDAKKYKIIQFSTLGVCILLLLIKWFIGLPLLAVWGALFYSPLQEKIPFLAKLNPKSKNNNFK